MNKLNYFDTSSQETDIDRINSRDYNIIGVTKADNNMYKEALEFFTHAIKLNPRDSVAFFNRATIEMQLGYFKEARKDFEKSQKMDVDSGNA